jgi:DNA-binding CsgD family transcriptional regulator/tetratricopeptide (TPR) repeat protein
MTETDPVARVAPDSDQPQSAGGALTWGGAGWWATRVGGSPVFVGRDRELSRLRSEVGGETRLLLVMGDAGVGKTRLVTEGTRRMAGLVAIWGGCLPMRETLPLLPVMDALGELSRVDGGKLLEYALAVTPRYVRVEVERLLPQLGSEAAESSGPGDGGQRDRLFAAIAELLGAVARRRDTALVVEDVHWADTTTLDCLTFLTRPRRDAAVTAVVTCRSDEISLESHVAEWLIRVRGRGGTTEVRLGPLSHDEVAEQIAELAGSAASALVVDELYARAEGNPFFTEQLVSAMVGSPDGVLRHGAALPARLGELLLARAAACSETAGTLLSALAVAGRPLNEDLLEAVSGLDVDAVHSGLHELATARLLADGVTGGGARPRHALLAEAVAAELLPGERARFHERMARALQANEDDTSAAEAVEHWAAAGRPTEELPARVHAAEAAERVFGYVEAARHWQRAIDLFGQVPEPQRVAGVDLTELYLCCLDALRAAGDERFGALAAEAYRRFAEHSDPLVAASVHLRFAWSHWEGSFADAREALQEALRLFQQLPPSAEFAKAWLAYGELLYGREGHGDARRVALGHARDVAEAAGATGIAADVQGRLAHDAFLRGEVADGLAMVERARELADSAGDGEALLNVATDESDTLLKIGAFDQAIEVGLRGLQVAREYGRDTNMGAYIVASNAAEALLALGRTAEAAQLIDSLTDGPAARGNFPVHGLRVEIDLLRGDGEAAASRLRQVKSVIGQADSETACETAQRAADVAFWTGRPADGLAEVREVLATYEGTDWAVQWGWVLVVGMRACAELAGQGRARRDDPATQGAVAAAGELVAWVERTGGTPFADHPYVATIPAARASWNAERSRLSDASDPEAWQAAADAWDALGCPHRAGYAGWRHAEARLLAGEPPAAVADTIRAAAAAAAGHVPLRAAIRALADRARVPLHAPSTPAQPHRDVAPYGLTERELLVLRLLMAGRSNGEIGAELFISRKTASVHVSNILRKLGVSTRVQAAALAERAGLVRMS